MGQRKKLTTDVVRRQPRSPVVQTENSGQGPTDGSGGGSVREAIIEVRFKLVAGATVHVGDAVVVRAGAPLTLVCSGREIGTFSSARIAAGLRAGFTFSGVVASVDAAERRGVAQLQVS